MMNANIDPCISNLIEALKIFGKYKGCHLGSDRDILCMKTEEDLSDDDKQTVRDLEWFWSHDWECYCLWI